PPSAARMPAGATYCGSPPSGAATSPPRGWAPALLGLATAPSRSAPGTSPPTGTPPTASTPPRPGGRAALMLSGGGGSLSRRRGEGAAFAALRAAVADADLVFANLETTVEAGDGHIPKEPRVLGDLDSMRRSLSAIGVGVVNLANNHAFDGDLAGFEAVRRLRPP